MGTAIAKVLLGLSVLVLVGLGFFLIPPHIQVRCVEPLIPSEADLRTFTSVPDGPVAINYIVNASQPALGRRLSHTSIIIEWADGRLFMIDAGMDAEGAAAFAELIKSIGGGGDATFVATVGDQLGDALQNVNGVGFTHLHIDHTQGLSAFCDARGEGATAFQSRWQNELHNFNTTEGAALVANSCLTTHVLDDAAIMSVPGFPGLGLVALGGHTPGSTLFAASVEGRLWLFSGDITNTMVNLQRNTGKGFIYSNLLVPENTNRTGALRLWLRDLDAQDDISVVVSHDLEALMETGMQPFAK